MEHILSLSYGKDSLACLGAIEQLDLPLDRIIHVEIWATDTIPADLPPMVEFKEKADNIIKERWGISVEHIRGLYTYEQVFYRIRQKSKIGNNGKIYGWPAVRSPWCTGELKQLAIKKAQQGCEVYLGIAADEVKRIERHNKPKFRLPLVEIGWNEEDCHKWCEINDLLSPIYTTTHRGGCWFCHNQGVDKLRTLRRDYPDYWNLMLKWDIDSPYSFTHDHTIHNFDKRFELEDQGLIPMDRSFRWSMLNKTKEELKELKEKHKDKLYLK